MGEVYRARDPRLGREVAIRAAAQRSKIRDLHDLSEIAVRVLDRDTIRSLAVLKLWGTKGPNLDYGRFRERIMGAGDYDVNDLATLLRKDQRPDLEQMIQRVLDGFKFLGEMTALERTLAGDNTRRRRADAETLRDALKERVAAQQQGPALGMPPPLRITPAGTAYE